MGYIRALERPGGTLRLDDHEGSVAPIRVDGFPVSEGLPHGAADTHTARHRAVCSCGWQGPERERIEGQPHAQDFDDLPELGNAWLRHTDRAFAELAGHPTTIGYDDSLGSRGWRPRCLGACCTWVGDIHPTEDGARGGERGHHEYVTAPMARVVRR